MSYNWRIITAPPHIVDYVVAHLFCHLKHPNHSPTYWKSVKRETADYDVFWKWFKVHGGELVI
ncbi:M48 family metallopeptidase [Alphaproteobacteria bacterium]|nr:M48 family metallopeptidase [Alphaproteobacteria bacterium]